MGIKTITINGRSDIKKIVIDGGVIWQKESSRWVYPVKTGDTLKITQAFAVKAVDSRIVVDKLQGYDLTLSDISNYGWEYVGDAPAGYDGVYRSMNNGINSSYAVMRIDFYGYDVFNVYIRSYAESSYDYTIASILDADSYPTSSDTATAFDHTQGRQSGGTDLNSYRKVTYSTDGGEHHVFIVYRKDGSAHSADDRGYVIIGGEL